MQLYWVYSRLREIRRELHLMDLFRYTTVEVLAAHLGMEATERTDLLERSRSRAAERMAALRPA